MYSIVRCAAGQHMGQQDESPSLGYVALGIAESIDHIDAWSLDWLPFFWFPALCGGGVLILIGVFKVVSPA